MPTLYTSRCNLVNTSRCLTESWVSYNFTNMNLANRIKAAREYAELTQIELSKKVSLPQQTISKLERGIQQETAALIKIAAACGVNPFWLDSGEGEMVGSLHIEDERIKRGVMLLEQLQDESRLDEALEQLNTSLKFSRKSAGDSLTEPAEHKKNGTQ